MKNRFELSSIFSTNGVSENANQVFGRKYLKLLHLMCYLCVRTSVTHVPGLYTLVREGGWGMSLSGSKDLLFAPLVESGVC